MSKVRQSFMGIAVAIALHGSPSHATAATTMDEPVAPNGSEILIEMARHQHVPELLCMTGVTPSQVPAIVQHATDTLTDRWASILAARAGVVAARATLSAALANDQQAAIVAAQSALADAESSLTILYNEIRNALDAGIESGKRGVLQTIRINQRQGLPLEYLSMSLPDESWVELRKVFAEVTTVQDPDVPDPAVLQIFYIYDTNPAVTEARSRLSIYGSQMSIAFVNALPQ